MARAEKKDAPTHQRAETFPNSTRYWRNHRMVNRGFEPIRTSPVELKMAKEIADIKQFLELTRRNDVKVATVKVNKKLNKAGKSFRQTKFKVRGSKSLYTLVVNDAGKAKKLIQSLPPTLNVNRL